MDIKTFSIKLTDAELEMLSSALVTLPYKDAAPLINRINQQLREQLEQAAKGQEQEQETETDSKGQP